LVDKIRDITKLNQGVKMNKVVIAVLAVVAVLAIAFGVFSFVRAERYQNQSFAGAQIQQGFGSGMMGNRLGNDYGPGLMNRLDNDFGPGMMGNRNGRNTGQGIGVMDEYQVIALAEKLGMTADDLTAQLNAGKTVLDLAADKGMTVKEFITMQDEVKVLAIDKAFAAGVISQNQADAMKANKSDGMMDGFGPGWRK
jgi:hypothetical protein